MLNKNSGDKLLSIMYLILIVFSKRTNNDYEFNYMRVLAENSSKNSTPNSTSSSSSSAVPPFKLPPGVHDVLSDLCHAQKRSTFDHRPCLITYVPCGDIVVWQALENRAQYEINRNDTLLSNINNNLDHLGFYHNFLDYVGYIGHRLNQVNMNIRSHYFVNVVREKELMKAGRSYFYLKEVRYGFFKT